MGMERSSCHEKPAEKQEAIYEFVRKRYEEMKLLNDFVLEESQGFFERILGRAKVVAADK